MATYDPTVLFTIPTGPRINGATLNEISGIIESRRHAGIMWMHEDSEAGTGANDYLYGFNQSGTLVKILHIVGDGYTLANGEWEDLAYHTATNTIWIANCGNNALNRATFQVYRITEPASLGTLDGSIQDVTTTARYSFQWGDALTGGWNCECMLIDPSTGRLYFVNKAVAGSTGLYQAPASLAAWPTANTLTKIASWNFGDVTGGDWADDNSGIYISRTTGTGARKYQTNFTTFEDFVLAAPINSAGTTQREALGVSANSLYLLETTEGQAAQVIRIDNITDFPLGWIPQTIPFTIGGGTPVVNGAGVASFGGTYTSNGTVSGRDVSLWSTAAAATTHMGGLAETSFGPTFTASGTPSNSGVLVGSFGGTFVANGIVTEGVIRSDWSSPAVAITQTPGAGATTFGGTFTALGKPFQRGAAQTEFSLTFISLGISRTLGAAASSFGGTLTGAGTPVDVNVVSGAGVTAFGGTYTAAADMRTYSNWTAAVVQSTHTAGAGVSSFGGTFAASGTPRTAGLAVAVFGFTGTVAGQHRTLGVAVAAFTANLTASGLDRALGQAATSFGGSMTAVGGERIQGQAVASFGGSMSVAGQHQILGLAEALFGEVLRGVGIRRPVGLAVADFGSLFEATGVAEAPSVVVGFIDTQFNNPFTAQGQPTTKGFDVTTSFGGVFTASSPARFLSDWSAAVVISTQVPGTGSTSFGFTATTHGAPVEQGAGVTAFGFDGSAAGRVILYLFSPPTHEEPIRCRPPYVGALNRYRLTYAKTIVRRNGTFISVRSPDPSWVVGEPGVDYFIGGNEYEITRATGEELEAAGYSVF